MAIKLIDIEASSPLPELDDLNGHSEAWALVKLNDVPVGYARLEPPYTTERLAQAVEEDCGVDLLRHKLYCNVAAKSSVPDETQLPFVSVVVCTKDRPRSLNNTLKSLQGLDYPHYEVVVVDNCPSTAETADVASLYPFHYLVEPKPGLDHARNRGIAESRGEIIAFIDDDAVADGGWLRGIAAGFADADVTCVTGLVLPLELETRAQIIFERDYWGFGRGFRRFSHRPANAWRYAAYWPSIFGTGCNMAFRREFFERAGAFDPLLDVGTRVGGGGDLDMFHRVLKSGGALAYRPDAVVQHKHREPMTQLRTQLAANGQTYTALFTKWWLTEPQSRRTLLRLIPLWYFRCFALRLLRRAVGRSRIPVGLILIEALGSLRGPLSYVKSVQQAEESDLDVESLEATANVH